LKLEAAAQVSDFGLSKRQVDLGSTASGAGEGLPVRYLSPEAIQRCRFSEKSDVWAFGVLLWEITTLCMVPYDSLGTFISNDADVKAGVCSGALKLPRPPDCPMCLYQLMTACWEPTAQARPTFRELRFRIQEAAVELHMPALPAQGSSPPASTAASAKSTGAIINPEVDSFLKEELEFSDDLVLKFKGMGVKTFDHLKGVTIDDLKGAGICDFDARLFIRTRPESSKPVGPPRAAPVTAPPLSAVSQYNSDYQEVLALLKDGTPTLAQIQAVLRQRPASAAVAKQACAAVKNMCANSTSKVEAGRLGLLADLQAALRKHPGSAAVAEQACWAVKNMCANDSNKVEAGRLGLLADLQAALRKHPGSAAVAEQACWAVKNMCANDSNKVEAGRLGLLADLQAALRKHHGSAAVAKQACAAVKPKCNIM